MTRYLDLGITRNPDPYVAMNFATACGAAWDAVDVPIAELRPGDVVVTGPWRDWSWLPGHIAIEVVPDDTPPAKREEPLVVALRERGLAVGYRNKPPKTERSRDWAAYHDAVEWVNTVATQLRHDVHIEVRGSQAPFEVVTDPDEARRVIAALDGKPFGFDFETNSLDPRKVTRFGYSFSDHAMNWWIPDVIAPQVLPTAVEFMRRNPTMMRASNVKYDLSVLACLVPDFDPMELMPYDTQPMSWLHRGMVGGNDLKSIARRLGRDVLTFDDVGGPELFWQQPFETQALYAAVGDTRNSYDGVEWLMRELRETGQLGLYEQLERPVTPLLAEMELAGLTLDRDKLLDIAVDFEHWENDIRAELRALGFTGAPTKDADIRRYLFDELGLPVLERTRVTQVPTVKTDTLRRLLVRLPEASREFRIVRLFIDFSEVDKARNTFVMPPLSAGWSAIRPSIGQTSVVSGRLSTSPNTQNIPGHGRRAVIREAYVAPDGCIMVDADYAQGEPRLSAHYSQDARLLRDFREGRDVYQGLGLDMGFPLSELGKHSERRQNLKITYLAWQYLTGAPQVQTIALKQDSWLSLADCRRYMKGMETSLWEFVSWRTQLIEQAARDGFVEDIHGRRRYTPGLHAVDPGTRDAAAREVANWPPQAGLGGIIKGAMPNVQRLFKQAGGHWRRGCGLINQVHDELLGPVPDMSAAQRAEFEVELDKAMCWYSLSVPMAIEVGFGKSWAEAKG